MNIVPRGTKTEPKILKTIYDGFGSNTTNTRWNLGTKIIDEKYSGDLSQQNFMGTKTES